MNNYLRVVFFSLLLFPFSGIAQIAPDSIPELEIWGFPEEKFAVGSQIHTIDSATKLFYGTSRLADVLQDVTPIYIRAYGPGNLASISFRGTGANHTAVLWNGININSPTLGQSDFYNLPNFAFNDISIQHGGGSALYGTGAIGGSIQLGNQASWKEGWDLTVQQSAGSFGKWQSAANSVYSKGNVEFATKLYHTQAENNFPFVNTQRIGSPKQRQEDAAYRQWGVVQDVFWNISVADRMSVHLWYAKSDREIQPPMTRLNSGDRQKDENFRSLISYQHLSDWGTSTVKMSWIHDFLNFNDGGQIDSRISTNRFTSVVSQEKRFGKKFETKLGLQLTHLQADVANYEAGTRENRWDAFWLSTYTFSKRLRASVQFRQTFLENFDPPFTPSLGLVYTLWQKQQHRVEVSGNVSKAYRVPTLNERFWQPGGNPDILPETSNSVEGTTAYHYQTNKLKLKLSATYFNSTIDNWVYWRPVPPNGNFSPQNVQKVRTKGLELTWKATVNRKKMTHEVGGNYAYTDAIILESDEPSTINEALFYVPSHKGNLYYRLGWKNLSFQTNVAHTGTRMAIARNELAAFTVLNAGIAKGFELGKTTWMAQLSVNNALGEVYQNYELYAMPGRNYEVTLRVKL